MDEYHSSNVSCYTDHVLTHSEAARLVANIERVSRYREFRKNTSVYFEIAVVVLYIAIYYIAKWLGIVS